MPEIRGVGFWVLGSRTSGLGFRVPQLWVPLEGTYRVL